MISQRAQVSKRRSRLGNDDTGAAGGRSMSKIDKANKPTPINAMNASGQNDRRSDSTFLIDKSAMTYNPGDQFHATGSLPTKT